MAISKVAYDGHTLIDLTQDTAVESDVASGKTFHKADGTIGVGTASGGGGTINLQNKTVNLGSAAPSSVSADAGYDGLGQVSFNVSGIAASNIKSGESICGVSGTYAGSATMARTCTIAVTIYDNTADPEPGATDTIDIYYRGGGGANPNVVKWIKQTITFPLGVSSTHSVTVELLAHDDPCEDGIYFGRLWDGATVSDVSVTGGMARYITDDGQGTPASEHCYITLTGTTATIHIDIPEGYR